jgi:hypothetical protein
MNSPHEPTDSLHAMVPKFNKGAKSRLNVEGEVRAFGVITVL